MIQCWSAIYDNAPTLSKLHNHLIASVFVEKDEKYRHDDYRPQQNESIGK